MSDLSPQSSPKACSLLEYQVMTSPFRIRASLSLMCWVQAIDSYTETQKMNFKNGLTSLLTIWLAILSHTFGASQNNEAAKLASTSDCHIMQHAIKGQVGLMHAIASSALMTSLHQTCKYAMYLSNTLHSCCIPPMLYTHKLGKHNPEQL